MAVDTHCHITLRFERGESAEVLSRARVAGVEGVLLIGYCPMHNGRVRDVLDRFGSGGVESALPALAGTAGVHPHEADKFGDLEVQGLRQHLTKPDIVAIGETGLDFFRDYAVRSHQESLFRAQAGLSSETGMPLVVHSRDAFEATVTILREFKLPDPPGVFHCFGYGPSELETVVEMGFFVSFAGMLTYPQSEALRNACRICPSERIMSETDSPFMVPQDIKRSGVKRNEPAYVMETVNKIASVRGIEVAEAEESIARNTLACFPKLAGILSWSAITAGLKGRGTG
jgi:TatD DNase family protein